MYRTYVYVLSTLQCRRYSRCQWRLHSNSKPRFPKATDPSCPDSLRRQASCRGPGCPPRSTLGPLGRLRPSSNPDLLNRSQPKSIRQSRPTRAPSNPLKQRSSRPSRTRVHGGGEEKTTPDMNKKPSSSRSTHSKTSTLLVWASSAPQILKPSGTSYPTCVTCRTRSLPPPPCQPSSR